MWNGKRRCGHCKLQQFGSGFSLACESLVCHAINYVSHNNILEKIKFDKHFENG